MEQERITDTESVKRAADKEREGRNHTGRMVEIILL